MSEGNSIVNLGDVAKPADTLIKKISSAVGGYFKPYQIRRVAEAEADAALIKAQSDIQITDLHRRAMNRFVHEEARRQENIESITNSAIPQLNQGADPSKIEDDWITNFFDKCRIVSDTEMQALWGKVLAGEANSPGIYSKRTIDFLGSLDRYDADCIQKIMKFSWDFGETDVLIYNFEDDIYKQAGLGYTELSHLETIGIISYSSHAGFIRKGFRKYGFTRSPLGLIRMEFKGEKDNQVKTGKAMLTKLGRQLGRVCESSPAPDFDVYVITNWAAQGVVCSSDYHYRKNIKNEPNK